MVPGNFSASHASISVATGYTLRTSGISLNTQNACGVAIDHMATLVFDDYNMLLIISEASFQL
jgi:hypothetical protein